MIALVLRLTFALTAAFALPMCLVRLQTYDDSAVRALLNSSTDCVAPCWEGISPGETRVTEALDILQAHPWVVDVRPIGREVSWGWSGAQPALIDSTKRGTLFTFWDRVTGVMIPTRIRPGDILLAGQQPSAVAYMPLNGTRFILYVAVYDRFALYNQVTCPLSMATIWGQSVALLIDRNLKPIDQRIQHFANYDEPLWRRRLPNCRG